MLFNSFAFLAFFALVLLVYWRLSHRWQNRLLLVASLCFYGAWNERLLLLLVASASIDYACALGMERFPRARRSFMLVSVVASLSILGFFKYCNFFLDSLYALLASIGLEASRPALEIVLPVGISFYTFQAMSYAVDVYRGELRACRSYPDYLLYVAFFPQLVAGPIERATRLLPQVQNPRPRLNHGARLEGVKLMAVGYFQKVAIADVLASTVDRAFAHPEDSGSLQLWLGLYAFAIQIYCDFAGYSNIARGTARLMGFDLMRNFAEPYLSTNITDFWRRWHISLSTWLRDYLYIPLGGNRHGARRTYANLLITMLLGGLWHGARWTFVVWGGLHGLYLALDRAWFAPRRGTRKGTLLGALVTFHLVCLAWIFFRADTFTLAWSYLCGLVGPLGGAGAAELEVVLYLGIALGLERLLVRNPRRLTKLFARHWALESLGIALLVAVTLWVGENHVVPFIYFQF